MGLTDRFFKQHRSLDERKTMADPQIQSGGCLCAGVRYSIHDPKIYNVICHCANCRRLTGSSFLTASIYPKEVSL